LRAFPLNQESSFRFVGMKSEVKKNRKDELSPYNRNVPRDEKLLHNSKQNSSSSLVQQTFPFSNSTLPCPEG
jgi:hypothetical protein